MSNRADRSNENVPDWAELNDELESNSNQESRAWSTEDYLRGKVSPELLRHFSYDEAFNLVKYFFQTPSTGTQDINGSYDLSKLNPEARNFLERELQGKDILEIGNAGSRVNHNLTPFNIGNYVGVDADYGDDALTHLMRQPEESAIVCSFGVLESGVLDSWIGRERPLGKYIDLLAREIYRVTPEGSITLHGTDGFDELKRAGFRDENVLYKGSIGDILTYRREGQ